MIYLNCDLGMCDFSVRSFVYLPFLVTTFAFLGYGICRMFTQIPIHSIWISWLRYLQTFTWDAYSRGLFPYCLLRYMFTAFTFPGYGIGGMFT